MYKKLEELSKLEANWDGYDSNKITEIALKNAKSIIHIIELNQLPIPQIVPMSEGGIMFEWPHIELECTYDGSIDYYVKVDKSKLYKLGNTLRYILL